MAQETSRMFSKHGVSFNSLNRSFILFWNCSQKIEASPGSNQSFQPVDPVFLWPGSHCDSARPGSPHVTRQSHKAGSHATHTVRSSECLAFRNVEERVKSVEKTNTCADLSLRVMSSESAPLGQQVSSRFLFAVGGICKDTNRNIYWLLLDITPIYSHLIYSQLIQLWRCIKPQGGDSKKFRGLPPREKETGRPMRGLCIKNVYSTL